MGYESKTLISVVVGAVVLGSLLGFLYVLVRFCIDLVFSSAVDLVSAAKQSKLPKVKTYFRNFGHISIWNSQLIEEIFNHIFVLIFGILMSVALYVSLDGEIRGFYILPTVIMFFVVKALTKGFVKRVHNPLRLLLGMIFLPIWYFIGFVCTTFRRIIRNFSVKITHKM